MRTSDASRPASAYRARASGSRALGAAPDGRTVGMRPTGFGSAECSLGIAPDGTLFVGPAFGKAGVGVIRSRDGGGHWELRVPDDGSEHRRIQPFTHVDAETGRVIFKTARFDVMPPNPKGSGYDVSISDDGGETWRHDVVFRSVRDWSKLYAGPPPAGDPDRSRITYFSGPSPFSTRVVPVAFPHHQAVRRSRDGGDTWERAGRFSLRPQDAPGGARTELDIYGAGVVAPSGTVFIGGRRGRHLAIAKSTDAGGSWTVADVPGTRLHRYHGAIHFITLKSTYLLNESVAVDATGTLYAIWPDRHDVLHGMWSADEGATWSRPVVVSAPGVTGTRLSSIVATGDGTVALAYYGRATGRGFHAYVAETRDFRAAEPTFTGGTINDPAEPLYPRGFDPGYLRIMLGGDLNEILHVRYAPDGTLHVACAMEMTGANRRHAFDPASRTRRLQAVVGRLGAA